MLHLRRSSQFARPLLAPGIQPPPLAAFARIAGHGGVIEPNCLIAQGAYRSLPPGEMLTLLPPGPCVASEKLDGETWFLHREGDVTTLLSPPAKRSRAFP